jgi:hypothetical protein
MTQLAASTGITAMSYYVKNSNLTVTVIDGKLGDIEKGKIDPRAIVVETLDATFEAIHVKDNRLYLDWFSITDLAAWLHSQRPTTNEKTSTYRLLDLFPGSSDISDLLLATNRCLLGIDRETAFGESSYFCGKVLSSAHTNEFAELRAACLERFIPRSTANPDGLET